MAKREILQLGDPGLHQRCAPVDVRAPSTLALVRDLADTLAAFAGEHGFGRAIAAPQLGTLARVLFVRLPGGFSDVFHNPVVEHVSDETFELWDDCFSFPELMVRVRRHQRLRVAYLDAHGAAQRLDAEGDLAELLQHEIDHLDGILATERAVAPTAFCTRAEWRRRYR